MDITVYNNEVPCSSMGRNGVASTTAVGLFSMPGGTLCLQPITSKGVAQNCWVELTTSAFDTLVVEYLRARGVLDSRVALGLLEELASSQDGLL